MEIKPKKEKPLIQSLINQHFCIKNVDADRVLTALNTSKDEDVIVTANFDWKLIYEEEKDAIFLLFDKIGNWTYLIWNIWDFQETIKLAQNLSGELSTQILYFFIDPWIATYRWIKTDKGEIKRAYYESHGQILHNEGILETEENIRKQLNISNEFDEAIYWELNKQICQPIDILNTKEEIHAIKGKIIISS